MAGEDRGWLDPDRLVVMCKSGNRSELAALMLQARGLDARNLEGGREAREAAGLPLVDSDGGPGCVL